MLFLDYFASLYSGEKRDIDELLRDVGLFEHADKKVSEFSKGMKSRLNFIKSLVHNPQILSYLSLVELSYILPDRKSLYPVYEIFFKKEPLRQGFSIPL